MKEDRTKAPRVLWSAYTAVWSRSDVVDIPLVPVIIGRNHSDAHH